ncbi:MAG: methionyl-tRNA formyltransferase [Thiomonas sp. SCN 64-16]|nr:MAG: methionyl-tRNA formyltransferase [Thiomonas sp. SCN 64-16]
MPASPSARRLRVAFAGTPEFAVGALRAILSAGYAVPLVLTQPDRPAGRGMKLQSSPVKQVASAAQIEVIQPQGLRLDGRYAEQAAQAHAALRGAQADVLVVAAYGLILPTSVLTLPRLGCLNIHGSLLPRWRGAAPIQRAIEAGDAQTGITLMQMDAGLDTGNMLLEQALPIDSTDTASTLHDKLAALGAALVVQGLDALERGELRPRPQPEAGVTYAAKISKDESLLQWDLSAELLARRVRAFTPWPGTQFTLPDGGVVKVGAAEALTAPLHVGPPGLVRQMTAEGLDVVCGSGVLRITRLQKPGGTMQSVAQWLQGGADLTGLTLS